MIYQKHSQTRRNPAPIASAASTPGVDNTLSIGATYHANNTLWIRTNLSSTASEFKSWLAAQYAAGTPVVIYYPLETPVEEDWDKPSYNTYIPENQ
jgi:hypothetical protein